MVGKNWYLLRKHRVEGPLKVEELKAMAASGHISPDDYVIESSDYKQGNLVYKKVMVLLDVTDFKNGLEKPNGAPVEAPRSLESKTGDSSSVASQQDSISYNNANHEVVSDLDSLTSSMTFGKVASFCVAVIVGMWGYDNYIGNTARPKRIPANSAQNSGVKTDAHKVKKSVILSQPKKEEVANQRVEKLMPTERPAPRLAPTKRPDPVASRPAPAATSNPAMVRGESAVRDRDSYDDRSDDRDEANDRGLASERDDAGWEPDSLEGLDLPPGEMMPPPEEFQGAEDAVVDEFRGEDY
ncbi:DUF4339 domain-containing protein [bacterium]|nr:DUF4339 domain-containing protein [bacterium]